MTTTQAPEDYPLYYVGGARYTVAGHEYVGATESATGSLDQVRAVRAHWIAEDAAFPSDYVAEYRLEAVMCWFCPEQATYRFSSGSGWEACPECGRREDDAAVLEYVKAHYASSVQDVETWMSDDTRDPWDPSYRYIPSGPRVGWALLRLHSDGKLFRYESSDGLRYVATGA